MFKDRSMSFAVVVALVGVLAGMLVAPPAEAALSTATKVANSVDKCPAGTFHDPRNGGECWKCPDGYPRRTAYPVTDKRACATPIGKQEKLMDADRVAVMGCPTSSFFDPIDKGTCWSCPDKYVRTLNSVKSKAACSRAIDLKKITHKALKVTESEFNKAKSQAAKIGKTGLRLAKPMMAEVLEKAEDLAIEAEQLFFRELHKATLGKCKTFLDNFTSNVAKAAASPEMTKLLVDIATNTGDAAKIVKDVNTLATFLKLKGPDADRPSCFGESVWNISVAFGFGTAATALFGSASAGVELTGGVAVELIDTNPVVAWQIQSGTQFGVSVPDKPDPIVGADFPFTFAIGVQPGKVLPKADGEQNDGGYIGVSADYGFGSLQLAWALDRGMKGAKAAIPGISFGLTNSPSTGGVTIHVGYSVLLPM